jgi:hypothetical protein
MAYNFSVQFFNKGYFGITEGTIDENGSRNKKCSIHTAAG